MIEPREWLSAIIESSHDAIISKTLEGLVISWNASAEQLFGYTAEEMIGSSILRLFPPERVGEEEAILERVRRGKRITHFETVRTRKDGHLIDVSVSISPIYDANGAI